MAPTNALRRIIVNRVGDQLWRIVDKMERGPIFCQVINMKIVDHCILLVICGSQKWNGAIPIFRRRLDKIRSEDRC